MTTGQPTNATNGCMPSAMPIIPWATDMIALMITLLCQANAVVGEGQDQDLETLPARNVEHLQTRYNTILSKAVASNPPRPRRPGTRGRVKQAPSLQPHSAATRAPQRGPSCASSPSCAFLSTTTRSNVTCACPGSSRKSLAAAAPIPVPRTLPSSVPTSQLAANNPTIVSTRSS